MRQHIKRFRMLIALPVAVLLVGTIGFMILERLSFIDAFYFTMVTISTVGYGDIAPTTVPGQTIAAFVMILGYGIIAVPTGIVSVELVQAIKQPVSTQACPGCSREGHDADAKYCKYCGTKL